MSIGQHYFVCSLSFYLHTVQTFYQMHVTDDGCEANIEFSYGFSKMVDAKSNHRQSEMLAHLEKPWLAHHVMSSMGTDNSALFPSIEPCFHLVLKMKKSQRRQPENTQVELRTQSNCFSNLQADILNDNTLYEVPKSMNVFRRVEATNVSDITFQKLCWACPCNVSNAKYKQMGLPMKETFSMIKEISQILTTK